MLTEENCEEIIKSYGNEIWEPFFELIRIIEETPRYSIERKIGLKNKTISLQDFEPIKHPVVLLFEKAMYEIPLIIIFDWGSWDYGGEIVRNQNFDYNSIDIVTKIKILSAIIRNDRFCAGALVAAFEKGLILRILKSIKEDLKRFSA